MKFTSETKLFVGLIGATVIIIAAAVSIFSQPAKPLPKADLVPPTAQKRGNPNANHYLVEFSDFQCPACKAFSGTVDTLANTYNNKLLIVYRNYPLPQHPQAQDAAMVAAAAGVQGKFWEMGDLLFTYQDNFSPAVYASLAAQLKLDMNKFNASLSDQTLKSEIQNDIAYGDQLSISATPTFYLDGVKLTLNVPADLETAVTNAVK